MKYEMYRDYHRSPYRRWACTIEAADTEAGFKILAHDPHVADDAWLHALGQHLTNPHIVRGAIDDDKQHGDAYSLVDHSHPDHFHEAVRTFPRGGIMGEAAP